MTDGFLELEVVEIAAAVHNKPKHLSVSQVGAGRNPVAGLTVDYC